MRKHTVGMLVTAVLLVMMLGCTSVYGVTIAGGKVETNTSKATTTGTTTGTSSTTGTTTVTGGTTSSAYTTGATGTTGTTGTVLAGGDASATTGTSAYTTRTNNPVPTGYVDDAMPFLIVMGIGIFMLLAFSHMQLNQTRYGKSEKYVKELKDFRKACSD